MTTSTKSQLFFSYHIRNKAVLAPKKAVSEPIININECKYSEVNSNNGENLINNIIPALPLLRHVIMLETGVRPSIASVQPCDVILFESDLPTAAHK